jgi:hypothetical protein
LFHDWPCDACIAKDRYKTKPLLRSGLSGFAGCPTGNTSERSEQAIPSVKRTHSLLTFAAFWLFAKIACWAIY